MARHRVRYLKLAEGKVLKTNCLGGAKRSSWCGFGNWQLGAFTQRYNACWKKLRCCSRLITVSSTGRTASDPATGKRAPAEKSMPIVNSIL